MYCITFFQSVKTFRTAVEPMPTQKTAKLENSFEDDVKKLAVYAVLLMFFKS